MFVCIKRIKTKKESLLTFTEHKLHPWVAYFIMPMFALANAGVDMAFHDTYFVIAHFHYVLSIATIYGIFCGMFYWLPKMCGRMYDETLAQWQFWITFIGVNVLFFPQHFLGMAGMPRRIPDYPDAYAGWNLVATFGAYISAFSIMWPIAPLGS